MIIIKTFTHCLLNESKNFNLIEQIMINDMLYDFDCKLIFNLIQNPGWIKINNIRLKFSDNGVKKFGYLSYSVNLQLAIT